MKKNIINIFILFFCGICCCCISSCTPLLLIHFSTAKSLNPDSHNHPLPVQVKLFELTDDKSFLRASFHELWQHDKNILGESLLATKNLILNPQQQVTLTLLPPTQARFLAVIAIYRLPRQHWRDIVAIKTAPKTLIPQSYSINLQNYEITIKTVN